MRFFEYVLVVISMYVVDYFGRCICSGNAIISKVTRIQSYCFALNIYAFSRVETDLLDTPLEVATSSPLHLPQGTTHPQRHVIIGLNMFYVTM